MVKKLEKCSNLTTSAPQQGRVKVKNLVQFKKSNMEHESTCSMESKDKKKPSRKKKQRAKTMACFKCKEKGHLIAECPVLQNETRSDPTGQTGWCPGDPTSLLQEQASRRYKCDAKIEASLKF